MAKRVNFYIDGLNVYFGFRDKKWQELSWWNIVEFCKHHLPKDEKEGCELGKVNYFTAQLQDTTGNAQKSFLKANKFLNKDNGFLQVIEGVLKSGKSWCEICTYDTETIKEKKTDVNIALHMLKDAVIDSSCDISILMTNDVDIVPSIEMIRNIKPEHRIIILVTPTNHVNYDLQNAAKDQQKDNPLDEKHNVIFFHKKEYTEYNSFQLPDEIIINGYKLGRPLQYTKSHITKKQKEAKKASASSANHDAANSSLQTGKFTIENLKDKFNTENPKFKR